MGGGGGGGLKLPPAPPPPRALLMPSRFWALVRLETFPTSTPAQKPTLGLIKNEPFLSFLFYHPFDVIFLNGAGLQMKCKLTVQLKNRQLTVSSICSLSCFV